MPNIGPVELILILPCLVFVATAMLAVATWV